MKLCRVMVLVSGMVLYRLVCILLIKWWFFKFINLVVVVFLMKCWLRLVFLVVKGMLVRFFEFGVIWLEKSLDWFK